MRLRPFFVPDIARKSFRWWGEERNRNANPGWLVNVSHAMSIICGAAATTYRKEEPSQTQRRYVPRDNRSYTTLKKLKLTRRLVHAKFRYHGKV